MAVENDERNLVDYVNISLDNEEEFHFLRFEFLQRLNIVHLQVDLARLKSRILQDGSVSSEDLQSLKNTMRDYATAIRDYQCLRSKKKLGMTEMHKRRLRLEHYFRSQNDFHFPFKSHYSYFQEEDEPIDPLRGFFMRNLPSLLAYSREERGQRPTEYSEGKPPKTVSKFVDRLARFLVAFTGGIFLVVPMIIMTLGNSQTKSLVTVSIMVALFALILSFIIRVSNIETLVSTATYAAVLVVFVGTTTNSNS